MSPWELQRWGSDIDNEFQWNVPRKPKSERKRIVSKEFSCKLSPQGHLPPSRDI
jgi:hypothetical protein